jgi:hypothetical protein
MHSIAAADAQLARVFEIAGGTQSFLEDHAVIAMADHSQSDITATIALQDDLADLGVFGPVRSTEVSSRGQEPRLAVCPSQRAAMVYALRESERDAMRASVATRALAIEGIELVMWLARDAHDRPSEAVIASGSRGELRFRPGGSLRDTRGESWSVEGALGVLGASEHDGLLQTPAYPDALSRVWAALTCPSSGEVLLSAEPGYEFIDWGRQAHVGGGSHGSLHACDSLGALLACGVELPRRGPQQWTIRDVAGVVLRHFGLSTA